MIRLNRVKTLVCVGVCALTLVCARVGAEPPKALTPDLLNAIRQVESSGNDNAVGDGGKAIGAYQIHRVYWQDAVEYDKTLGGTYADCYDPEYARRVVIAYLSRYAPKNATAQDLARIHNGGPKGHTKKATAKYWNKVKKEL